jgi:TatD DNase family protein
MSFDAHTHLDFPAFDGDRDIVIANAREVGLTGWAIAGTEPEHWDRVLAVAAQTGGTPLIGVHPWWAADITPSRLDVVLNALEKRCPPSGLGEIGLDYRTAKPGAAREHQIAVFRGQLALARALDRPVALHCVRAYADLLHIVKTDGLPAAGGLMHGWGGGPQFVEIAVALGLFVSFGPSVLDPRRKKVRDSAVRVPLAQLCIETDCPDQPLAGSQRGELADLRPVAEGLAALRGDRVETLWARCGDNARRLWRVENS